MIAKEAFSYLCISKLPFAQSYLFLFSLRPSRLRRGLLEHRVCRVAGAWRWWESSRGRRLQEEQWGLGCACCVQALHSLFISSALISWAPWHHRQSGFVSSEFFVHHFGDFVCIYIRAFPFKCKSNPKYIHHGKVPTTEMGCFLGLTMWSRVILYLKVIRKCVFSYIP